MIMAIKSIIIVEFNLFKYFDSSHILSIRFFSKPCLNLIIVLGIFKLGKGNSTFLSSDKSLTEVLTAGYNYTPRCGKTEQWITQRL